PGYFYHQGVPQTMMQAMPIYHPYPFHPGMMYQAMPVPAHQVGGTKIASTAGQFKVPAVPKQQRRLNNEETPMVEDLTGDVDETVQINPEIVLLGGSPSDDVSNARKRLKTTSEQA